MATSTTTARAVAVAALVLALLACHGTSAKSPAPPEAAGAPSPAGGGCLTALTNMSDCLTFVEDGSKLTKPDKGCCPELAGLVDSNPICLCQLLGNSDSIGIKIDLNKALKLPSLCRLTTPPVSTCSAIGVPVSLPPSMSPSLAPATSPSNNAGGPGPSSDKATSSPSESKNGASSLQASALTFIFGLSTLSVSIFFY